jgi:hypothetical protein
MSAVIRNIALMEAVWSIVPLKDVEKLSLCHAIQYFHFLNTC